jgi:antitoxin FitA
MPTLTVRQLEDDVYRGLKAQAESSGRSMEAEVREILASVVRGRAWWAKWVRATASLRGTDLPIPPRSAPRDIDLV